MQVIPLHLPAGDTSTERTVHIDGTQEQIEIAKQLVIEVTSEVRFLSLSVYIPDTHDCFVVFVYLSYFRLASGSFCLVFIFMIFPGFLLKILVLLLVYGPTLITLMC